MLTRKITIISAGSLLLLLIAGFLIYAEVIEPRRWYPNSRSEAVRILRSSHTTNELVQAVGPLGLFIPLTNNAWIAIRYRDRHGGGIWSCAVALDSGGGWFESDRHFCGALDGYKYERDAVKDLEEMQKRGFDVPGINPSVTNTEPFRELMAVESAPDLATARRALITIGFREFQP